MNDDMGIYLTSNSNNLVTCQIFVTILVLKSDLGVDSWRDLQS